MTTSAAAGTFIINDMSFKLPAFIGALVLAVLFQTMVQVDSWNAADPQKIMDLIPQGIRPFVVMAYALKIAPA